MRHSTLGRLMVAGVLVAAALAAQAAPVVHAQEGEPSPEASSKPGPSSIPVRSASGRPDLYLDMPYNLGGFEPEIAMARGEEHFADLDAEDPTRRELEGLLAAVGAEVGDMVSGYALVSQEDFFSFVVAIRIDGIEPGSLLPAYLPILYGDLEDPQGSTRSMGGKDVVVITSLGENDEYVELHVYDEGDTVWMLQGPTDVVETALSNLPDPLPREG
jgi:hypothetical protein